MARSLMELVLSNALAASFLALLVVMISYWIRRPRVRHSLWAIVMLRLLMPPIGLWELDPLEWSPLPVSQEVRATSVRVEPMSDMYLEEIGPSESIIVVHSPTKSEPREAIPVIPATVATVEHTDSWGWECWLVTIWLTGAGVIWLRGFLRARRFARELIQTPSADAALTSRCAELASRFGIRRVPDVRVTNAKLPPLVWGSLLPVRRPIMLLPSGLIERMSPTRLDAVIGHELAHIRRGDLWWRRLEWVLAGLYWWFPLVAWFRARLREAEEECCDAMATDRLMTRREYAESLVDAVDFLNGPGLKPAPRLACGIGPVPHLRRRVKMIMQGRSSRLGTIGVATVLALGVVAIGLSPVLADEERGKPKPPAKGERVQKKEKDATEERERGRRPEKGELQEIREELEEARAELREQMERVRKLERRAAELGGGGRFELRFMPPGELRFGPMQFRAGPMVPPGPPRPIGPPPMIKRPAPDRPKVPEKTEASEEKPEKRPDVMQERLERMEKMLAEMRREMEQMRREGGREREDQPRGRPERR